MGRGAVDQTADRRLTVDVGQPLGFGNPEWDRVTHNTVNPQCSVWWILIADDDEEVHTATTYALRGIQIDGRSLELLHANSAAQAREILSSRKDIAVAMLDVVMETSDAGLKLVEFIRKEQDLQSIRIVLRTGQPGQVPELEAIRRYDINDYRTKGELTQNRLLTTLIAALRAYQQIELISAMNQGMQTVSTASNEIFRLRTSKDFAKALLNGIVELLGRPIDGLVCLENGLKDAPIQFERGLYIEQATGRYVDTMGLPVAQILDVELRRAIQHCIEVRNTVFESHRALVWFGNSLRDAVAVIELTDPITPSASHLLSMFSANLGVGFENVDLIERLDFFAFRDPLTHLSNRTQFIHEIDQSSYIRQQEPRCLALVDIARFSDINNSLGYRSGDSLLVAISKRLQSAVVPSVVLGRLSGNCFGLFGTESEIDPKALIRAFSSSFFVHGHAFSVQVCVGIVSSTFCEGNATELLRNASLALNHARKLGMNSYSFFTQAMSDELSTQLTMLHDLRAAIDFKRGLSLVYQPLINAETGVIVGAEALLRWRNEKGEAIPPMRFIPLAERTGMINELGLWVLEQALDQHVTWRCLGFGELVVCVNISVVQLRSEKFLDEVCHLLEYCDVKAEMLCFEIDESACLDEAELIATQFKRLQGAGIHLSIDDFGAAKSSLHQFVDFPFNTIKLAANYTEKIVETEAHRSLACSVVNLATRCGRHVVAKGVETPEQAKALRESGCQYMQGFHFGRPMTANQFKAWYAERYHNDS
jgi:diguanylate cyclase